MRYSKISKLAFGVIKFKLDGENYYLLRKDPRWHDYNFMGGHLDDRDRKNFENTVRREIREEFPPIRSIDFGTVPLTPLLKYGPVFSKSAQLDVLYLVCFFQ